MKNQAMYSRGGGLSKKNGFTLIELLVVIAVIGILASVILASLNSARAKARDAKRISDIRQVQNALEMYYTDSGVYPLSGDTLLPSVLAAALVPIYISSIPTEPSGLSYSYYTQELSDRYAIRIPYETKTACYVGSGPILISGYWGLSLCK